MLYLNGQPVPVTIFPDKTSQVWKLPESVFSCPSHHIEWVFESEGEFIHLAQLVNLLSLKSHYAPYLHLTLKYLPYGRQDKQVANDATFALRTFAILLNSLSFDSVRIIDPHSRVALDLISNSEEININSWLFPVVEECGSDLLCYPDKGAHSKYCNNLILPQPYIYGEKVRDQATGNILSYSIVGDPADKNVLIVDDICDGGMTFKLLAKDLLAAGAKSVVLFVTHGIFSKGLQTLKDSGIQRIFTQDGEASEEAGQIIYRRL